MERRLLFRARSEQLQGDVTVLRCELLFRLKRTNAKDIKCSSRQRGQPDAQSNGTFSSQSHAQPSARSRALPATPVCCKAIAAGAWRESQDATESATFRFMTTSRVAIKSPPA